MPISLAAVTLLAGVFLTAPAGGSGPNGQVPVATSSQPSAAAEIEAVIEKEGLSAARVRMQEIEAHADRYSIGERDINGLGYRYLARKAFQEALAVFEFNVRRFPASNNVYDSLAEASAAAGDEARLEATLKAWKAKSPGDAAVEARARALRALMERSTDERRHAYVPGQPTGVEGVYFGQTPPGTTPTLFAPGIVSLAFSTEAFASMSQDGKEFYFAATGRNPGATVAPPAGRARFFGPDAVMVSRVGPGGWTFPEPVPVTAGYAAREPHVSPSNGTVFWEWLRAVPPGEADPQNLGTGIWSSRRTPSGWSEPRFVGQGMAVTSSGDGEFFVTDVSEVTKGNSYVARVQMKGGDIYWVSTQLIEALRPSKGSQTR